MNEHRLEVVDQFTYLQVTEVLKTDRFKGFRVGVWICGSNGSFHNDELMANTSADIDSSNSSSCCRVVSACNDFIAAELGFHVVIS